MDTAIVFSYGNPSPGRETLALEAFTQAVTFFGTRAHQGECEEPLTYIGPSGRSLMIVPGTYEKLTALARTEEFLDLLTKAILGVPDLSYDIGFWGPGVQSQMARWSHALEGLVHV